jgi:hypothetical protein
MFAKLIPPDFESQADSYFKRMVLFETEGDARYSIEEAFKKLYPDIKFISNAKKSLLFEIEFYGGIAEGYVSFNFTIGQKNAIGYTVETHFLISNTIKTCSGDFAKLLQDLTEKQMKEF